MRELSHMHLSDRIPHRAIGLVLAGLLLNACASNTKVASAWHDQAQRNSRYDRLLVVAVSDNADRRLSFEDALVSELNRADTNAWASARLMRTDMAINEENLRTVVAQQQANAIIVTKLESVQVTPVESGGRSDVLVRQNETGIGMTPRRKSGTVFQYDYEERIEPVFITTEYTAVVTTDVYSVAGSGNVYSVATTTSGQESVADVIAVLSQSIAKRLRSDGVVR